MRLSFLELGMTGCAGLKSALRTKVVDSRAASRYLDGMTTPGPTTTSTELEALAVQLASAFPGAERLAVLVRMRELVEQEIRVDVVTMHNRHSSWARVGEALGITKQAAWERYGR